MKSLKSRALADLTLISYLTPSGAVKCPHLAVEMVDPRSLDNCTSVLALLAEIRILFIDQMRSKPRPWVLGRN